MKKMGLLSVKSHKTFCYNMSRKWVVDGETHGIKEVFLIEAMKTCLSVIEMIKRREHNDAKEGLWGN